MKATEFLKRQHRDVMQLFKEALKADGTRQRKELLGEIETRLALHMGIEEEIFYPAVREEVQAKKTQEQVAEAYEEHHVVKLVLQDLREADLSAESYAAKLTVLKELVEHHVEEEEGEMFPAAEKKLGAEELRELGERLQARAEALEGA
jgi:hemerythrin-like domain-containing protein